jgi:hypothetical protein
VSEKAVANNEKKMDKLAKSFYKQLVKNELPKPSLFDLFIFRMSRTSMKNKLDENFRDYTYYTEKGWFSSDFYYPVKLSITKKVMGKLFDTLAK